MIKLLIASCLTFSIAQAQLPSHVLLDILDSEFVEVEDLLDSWNDENINNLSLFLHCYTLNDKLDLISRVRNEIHDYKEEYSFIDEFQEAVLGPFAKFENHIDEALEVCGADVSAEWEEGKLNAQNQRLMSASIELMEFVKAIRKI